MAQLVAALVILALLVRVSHILTSNPIGDLPTELLYLRVRDLQWAGLMGLTALLLEVYEFLYPWITMGVAGTRLAAWPEAINGIQALLIMGAAIQLFRTIRQYSPGGVRRRIDGTMEEIADRRGPRSPTPAPDEAGDEEE